MSKIAKFLYLIKLNNVQGFPLDLHGPDDLILRVDVTVEDVSDLIPAGLDGAADPVHLLQARLICGGRGHKVLLVWEPPEEGRQVLMICLICSVSLIIGNNLNTQ